MHLCLPWFLLCCLCSLPGLEDFKLKAAIQNTNPASRHYPAIRVWQSTDRETRKQTMWADVERSDKLSVQLSDEQMRQMIPLVQAYVSGMSATATQAAGEREDDPQLPSIFNGLHHWMKIEISIESGRMVLSSSDYYSPRVCRLQQPIINLAYKILRPPPEDGQEPTTWYPMPKKTRAIPGPSVPAVDPKLLLPQEK